MHSPSFTFGLLLLLAAAPAAAQRPARPVAADACQALARSLSDATGIAVRAATGPARTVDDRAPRGEGCVITGTATGLTRRFGEVSDRLVGTLRGWRHDVAFDADGPMSLVRRYSRDGVRVIVFLETENPPGTCADVPIGDCRVPLRRWTWTLKAVAYR
jgi:hypothetical protein